ncbi:hypothetical protein JRQ81_012180 [Phrynocephalus forsythii]|uniref:Uncharacterized protein n=1 Tax=Phrynocephalus forsythii TaxID=171643 RepID=A0A9Q0Y1Y5_9SAUR|nr:hypothetical protein JRQ81_012180 [Phrynocephalus forsythii]
MDPIQKELEEVKKENQSLFQINKDLTDTIVIELDRASSILRLLNIPEKERNLTEQITTILAEVLGIETEEMEGEIDKVYRANLSHARRNNIPCEIHVKFVKRTNKR